MTMSDTSAVQQTANPEKGLSVRQQKAVTIRRAIESREVQLLDVMPYGMDLKRFIRTTLIAVSQNDALLDCTPESLITAIFEAAECGIEPTGSLGRGYLVPIKDHGVLKANFWIGYPGLIELAMRSKVVSKVWSRPVFKGDKFEVHYGTRDEIVHDPQLGEEVKAGDLTHIYACCAYKDGAVDFEVLTKEQVDLVRARAKGANLPDSPWNSDYIEQARKTGIRKLAKRMPLTAEAARAIQKDEEREFGLEERRHAAEKAEKRADSLGESLRQRAGRQKAPEKPQNEPEVQDGQPATPDASAAQQTPAVEPVAEKAQPTETVEGEVVCDDESPYEDGARCVLVAKHKEFHKGATGATWGRSK
jgi:recombination protein RecT